MTHWTRRLAKRLRALTHGDSLDRDVAHEMRLHIEMEAKDLARMHGIPADEARRRAAIAFGSVDRFAEEHRDARGVRWLEEITQDVRYAARALRRSPGFTITATLVLALGIGASTAIFSAVDAVLVSRLPYPDDDRIVRIVQQNSPTNRFGLSAAICTKDLAKALSYVQQAEAGVLMVNLPSAGIEYQIPFGGLKDSSAGPREQGPAAVQFYTETKTVYVKY